MKFYLSTFFVILTNILFAQDNSVDQPFKNFKNLWEITKDHYCNFDQLKIDWEVRYQYYRHQISDSTTNDELFLICGNLLKELDDRHVWITRKGNYEPTRIESGKERNFLSEFLTMNDVIKFNSVTDSILKSKGFSPLKIIIPSQYGLGVSSGYSISDSLVYLQINGMGGSSVKIKKAMRTIVDSLKSRKGLIIDIRLNGGGYDKKGYLFAKYLTSSDQIAIYKHTRIPKTDEFTSLKKHIIKTTNGQSYTGPVVLLTSDYTLSAADVFALALSNFKNVKIVGNRTGGFFSDVSTYTLPNGWNFTLSTQKYYSINMTNYERIGVQPDYKILNTMQSCKKGEDPVLRKALGFLSKNIK